MTQNPFTAALDAQRTAIERTQTFTHDVLDAQQASMSAFADAVASSNELVSTNAEFTKGAIYATIDALEASAPDGSADFDELRELVDESVDGVAETQTESLDAVREAVEESEVAYEEFAAGYAEVVDASFDAVLDAHEQVERNAEIVAETVDDADEFDVSA